jgi:hypothetical protein
MKNGIETEDYSKWVMFGMDGDTYVGKPSNEEEMDEFYPCYKITVHTIPIQQTNMSGQVVGVSLNVQQTAASPGNVPVDVKVELNMAPAWIVRGKDPKVASAIEMNVKSARAAQDQLRAATAGIALR